MKMGGHKFIYLVTYLLTHSLDAYLYCATSRCSHTCIFVRVVSLTVYRSHIVRSGTHLVHLHVGASRATSSKKPVALLFQMGSRDKDEIWQECS